MSFARMPWDPPPLTKGDIEWVKRNILEARNMTPDQQRLMGDGGPYDPVEDEPEDTAWESQQWEEWLEQAAQWPESCEADRSTT